ncbi:helicase HerA-like domain-containing protein [Rhizobium rhizogenes]
MAQIDIGTTAEGKTISLPLKRANRHGLVTGSTGGGKTVTLQRLAEQFSLAGVPVFASDVKGDLSGIATNCPTQFWDLFGTHGLPIRTSVQAMGSELLARMLKLNDTQEGTLAIAFKKAEDERDFMLTLDDLRFALLDMLDNREAVCRKYGNVTGSSINAIQRSLLTLESQGGFNLFGEPPFDIRDFMMINVKAEGEAPRGVVNLLHADRLMEAPKLYATFLLWLLTELFRTLPEVGDLAKPKMVFFFDEAHLLFTDAPANLLQSIERLVRLVRSKGVGVYFVTQSVSDVPETVLAQLGTKIQHALRAFTPKDQRTIKATAAAFRENRGVDVRRDITTLPVGTAFVSVLDEEGIPTKVEKVSISKPAGQIGAIESLRRDVILKASPLRIKYSYAETEGHAAKAFDNRMRQERGLPPIIANEDWPEGRYAAYLPNLTVETIPNSARADAMRRFLSAVLILAGSFGLLYLSTHI